MAWQSTTRRTWPTRRRLVVEVDGNSHEFTEGPGDGREKGYGLVPSRVVCVTVLEPGSDGEYRFGGRDHSVVYDIEVADNHNYFANGVLVSNCHAYKNLETPTKMDRVAGIQTGGSGQAFDLFA